jgi:hypothetical protein
MRVEHSETIFELPTCSDVSFKSVLMTSGMRGENANHDKKATKNPSHDRWKLREYWLFSEKIGTVEHLRLAGLITG